MVKWMLTVPHAMCPTELFSPPLHPCDVMAKKAAEALSVTLDGHVVLVSAETLRIDGDLNRQTTRTNKWHDRWQKMLVTKGNWVLIDVHSFGDLSHFDPTDRAAPIIVLDSNDNQPWTHVLADDVPGAKWVRGSKENFITITAVRDYHVPAVLLEFWEGMSNADLERHCADIARALYKIF